MIILGHFKLNRSITQLRSLVDIDTSARHVDVSEIPIRHRIGVCTNVTLKLGTAMSKHAPRVDISSATTAANRPFLTVIHYLNTYFVRSQFSQWLNHQTKWQFRFIRQLLVAWNAVYCGSHKTWITVALIETDKVGSSKWNSVPF